jgi:uncharacterized protein YndB with AHSA1/START domain
MDQLLRAHVGRAAGLVGRVPEDSERREELMEESPGETLTVTRTVPAQRKRVFRAWTRPAELKKWWSIGEGWKTSSAKVDLRVGGKFSIGNEPPGGGAVVITGEFLVVEPPSKLVYTWIFPGNTTEESMITVEFRDLGKQTEVVVTHAKASKAMLLEAIEGWDTALAGLEVYLGRLAAAGHN